ncbi:MAG: hypothetical protein EBS19_08625, partial [Spirochaetia bacterium]|nr:hypothetical protein [Spirochaetia bacterium]
MIGLSVSGKSYNFSTKEISINDYYAEVIHIEKRNVCLWINGSHLSLECIVDVLTCKNYEDDQIIEIPVFLLTRIDKAPGIDTNFFVEGNKTNFIGDQKNTDFLVEENLITKGFIIGKYACPLIEWGNGFRDSSRSIS